MLKEQAVATLGQKSLLMPAWVKSALLANDRLKLYLTLLQSAAQHAASPAMPVPDWGRDLAQAGLQEAGWLQDLVKTAYLEDSRMILPHLEQLMAALLADLTIMARPICDGGREGQQDLIARYDTWANKLPQMGKEDGLSNETLVELTRGDRQRGASLHDSFHDSFHILVMDLHKQLNAMAGDVATETLDGAHVWQIIDTDRPLIEAFMRGLHRTAPLKFSHPGLDTAVTRDGARLLIQNDIGTNDVHVLVIEVAHHIINLTYSDLHAARFDFFKELLEQAGYEWSVFDPVTTAGLNAGKPYQVGKATLAAKGQKLLDGLEAVASRIVFLIDWNRARKRLQNFISKPLAYALLQRSAQEELGHMAWLLAGGERLVFNTMQTVDSEAFRVGDRLDEVLGDTAAAEFLFALMRISSIMLRQQQPVALIADEARMLLVRVLRQRTFEFDLVAEHAACCHALALALCDALENSTGMDAAEGAALVLRAKASERQADHLLMEARQRAERQSRWMPVVALLEKSDDVADDLEEAIFILSMTLSKPLAGLPAPVNEALRHLADTTLAAIQDQIRAIEIARHLSERGDAADSDLFLQALWRMLRAERQCDALSRQARMIIITSLADSPAGLMLASDLANTIEKASDGLLASGYALREMVLTKTGVSS